MITRFSIKSILAGSLVVFLSILSSTASAWVTGTSTSQLGCTALQVQLGQCSIKSSGLLKGLGNATGGNILYEVSLLVQEGYLVAVNPAFNADNAQGTPFQGLSVQLNASQLVNAEQISKNGRATSDIIFHDDELVAIIVNALDGLCTAGDQSACDVLGQYELHPNWYHGVVVTKLQVMGIQKTDGVISGALGSKCEAPAFVQSDPTAWVWQAFDYGCADVCNDDGGKKLPACSTYNYQLPLP